MNEHRGKMMEAFKARFVPGLRARGFKGAFPYFHRPSPERVDYLMVQFYSSGGSFVLEAGRSGPRGVDEEPWDALPVEKLTPAHMDLDDRKRLETRLSGSSMTGSGPRGWWAFGPRSTDPPQPLQPQSFYEALAEDALAVFLEKGEPWFGETPPPREQGPPPLVAPWPLRPLFGGRFTHLFPWNGPRLRIASLLDTSERRLCRWETMRELIAPMDALTGRLPRPAWINSFQIARETGARLPFGRLPWSEASNREWTTKYLERGEEAVFDRTEFWSPSRSAWAENMRKPPELYARIEETGGGQQGFLLALRHDQLPAAADAADAVLAAVERLLPKATRIVFDRVWCEAPMMFGLFQGEPLDHTNARDVMQWGFARPRLQVSAFATGVQPKR